MGLFVSVDLFVTASINSRMDASGSGSGNISAIGCMFDWSLATSGIGISEELQGIALRSVCSGSGSWTIQSKDLKTRFLICLPMAAVVPKQVLSSEGTRLFDTLK